MTSDPDQNKSSTPQPPGPLDDLSRILCRERSTCSSIVSAKKTGLDCVPVMWSSDLLFLGGWSSSPPAGEELFHHTLVSSGLLRTWSSEEEDPPSRWFEKFKECSMTCPWLSYLQVYRSSSGLKESMSDSSSVLLTKRVGIDSRRTSLLLDAMRQSVLSFGVGSMAMIDSTGGGKSSAGVIMIGSLFQGGRCERYAMALRLVRSTKRRRYVPIKKTRTILEK
jgi:hypothetical protein